MKLLRFKWWYLGLSLVVLLPGLYSIVRYGLRLSIDFTGGTLLEIHSKQAEFTHPELVSVQNAGGNVYLLKFRSLDKEQKEKFMTALGKEVVEKRYELVGPVVGSEMTKKAVLAILVASGVIILFIAWSFRHVPKPYSSWKFGLSAVAALIHDVFVVLGVFSLLGHYYHVEIDALFVTAMLTIIGFSVHDTIVVFDRIRENLPKMVGKSFEEVVDFSLEETLVRSLNTSFTVILTLTALLLFGGASIRWFVVALLVGIVSGTYSSIFNAAPLLVLWESRKRSK